MLASLMHNTASMDGAYYGNRILHRPNSGLVRLTRHCMLHHKLGHTHSDSCRTWWVI